MAPEELREVLRQQPFHPFRLLMTDGVGYEVRHPDLLLIGRRSAVVGTTDHEGEPFYERTVRVDLMHVIRVEPLAEAPPPGHNGPASGAV